MSTFTVKSTMPTGKANEKFGKEFYVQFNETEQAFPLWFKEAPAVGKEIDGEISNGKFKKIRKEWNPNAAPEGDAKAPATTRPAYKDNSDGMRQGMCFNNAANFVNTLVFEKTLTDREWADLTFAYAQALYLKGDLNVPVEGSQEEVVEKDPVETVKEVFGGGTKLVTPRGN
jgi:hypothetical protein